MPRYESIFKIDGFEIESILGPLEQKIMRILWSAERRLALRPITVRVALDFGAREETTICATLKRMTRKGLLCRQGQAGSYTWEPAHSEMEFRLLVAQQVLRKVRAFAGDSIFDQVVAEVEAE